MHCFYLSFQILQRDCLHSRKDCSIHYTGSEDGLHLLSKVTAAGDEIGWEFINTVMKSQFSISAFCDMKDSLYYGKARFMSRQTFTDWIFTWLVNFNVDFRQVCSVCGENPPVLAADGTKLGIYFRNISVAPIETPEVTAAKKTPLHRRNDRQFFSYSISDSKEKKKNLTEARHCLGYFVAKNSGGSVEFKKSSNFKVISGLSDEEMKAKVISCLSSELCDIVSDYIGNEFDQSLTHVLNPIFRLCATEYPLTSLINYRLVEKLSEITDDPQNHSFFSIHDELPEIFLMYKVAKSLGESSLGSVNTLVKYLVKSVRTVHRNDGEVHGVDSPVNPYNPPKQGRAYYFTKEGSQLRPMPSYTLTDDNKNDGSLCQKTFAHAGKSGTTFLFLVFDPAHYGHCYGFHMITTSEGRKDAFCPPYLYMEDAPKEYFYDFACQLEEYSLNREPKFWRKTRFWHDIFHGFTHKCPFVYSSRRIHYLHKNNTEICEQFNAFVQKVKYCARSMNQEHFIFFLQFFIHQWNVLKQTEYLKQLATANSLSL